ncbi:MAG: glutamate-5-semialdehyde dehydrogenase [Bacteroidales bacterium]|nr:glutamate-5-semialdehyde dehydrogenase [Clostridium sp.]MCM1204659.1 glutamate-5-semialdehyde dehydrogenase [Bacteroidales bacterium]
MELEEMGKLAKEASRSLIKLPKPVKQSCLSSIAKNLVENTEEILAANQKDIENGVANYMPEALLDRLRLTKDRIEGIAEGVRQVAALEDPVGEVLSMKERPNGLMIGKKRVPLGVIGIIYESRPNVTVDAFSLCFKTGNAVILRGGSDAIYSNIAFVKIIRKSLEDNEVTPDAVFLLEDTSRETATKMMKLNGYIDVLIPRGGAGLIRSVVENATVPVIETGTGNCHIFIDATADVNMAVEIVKNAKLQRLGVCNACESLVIHRDIVGEAAPRLIAMLKENACEIRGDETIQSLDRAVVPAEVKDYGTEYLDKIISVKVVDSVEEAIAHINQYSTGHSEAILTKDYDNAQKFLNEIDSAAVYVNASTRYTDGFEFGFGAEIGISTQKLHARGPMGLEALTTTKYIIYGNGQVRP